MSSSDVLTPLEDVAGRLEALVASGRTDEVNAAELQRLISAVVRCYAAKAELEGRFPVVPRGTVTATDVMVTTTALLEAVNVAVFELGLWQSWAH
jgi:hypothetical protein